MDVEVSLFGISKRQSLCCCLISAFHPCNGEKRSAAVKDLQLHCGSTGRRLAKACVPFARALFASSGFFLVNRWG